LGLGGGFTLEEAVSAGAGGKAGTGALVSDGAKEFAVLCGESVLSGAIRFSNPTPLKVKVKVRLERLEKKK